MAGGVGAFKCAPRDRWTGWKPEQRLSMVANNTRFLILSEPGVFANLTSRFLACMTRRLCDDWLKVHGAAGGDVLRPGVLCWHDVEGWQCPGSTKGFARSDGRYPHGKEITLRH